MALELVFEAGFVEASLRRPAQSLVEGRSSREVDGLLKDGHCFVVDADIEGYFDGRVLRPDPRLALSRIS